MSENKPSIEDKIKNLEKQISWFDSEDFAINQAIEKYELAKKLSAEITADIEQLKNKITIVNKKTS